MKKANETKIVKYIHYYLKGFTYLMPLIFFIGYIGILLRFIKEGDLIGSRFSILGVSFISVPKEIIFGRTDDALIVLVFALILFLLFMSVFYFALKFIKNVLSDELLIEQNGILLKIVGILLIGFAVVNVINEIFHTLGVFGHKDNVWMFSKAFMIIVPSLLMVFLHPIFVLGLFFILLGEILVRASIVKQENDLTV